MRPSLCPFFPYPISMSDFPSPPKKRVGLFIFNFICVACLIAVFCVGWYGLQMQERGAIELSQVHVVRQTMTEARRLFAEMRLHAVQRTKAQDTKNTDQFKELLMRLEELRTIVLYPPNKELVHRLESNVYKFAELDEKSNELLHAADDRKAEELTAINDEKDRIVAETEEMFEMITDDLGLRYEFIEEATYAKTRVLMTSFLVATIVGTVFCIATGTFLSIRGNRSAPRDSYNQYVAEPSATFPRDLSDVAAGSR